ncbi:MAG: DNA-binding response regulator [Spirochaetaceae bacterium]|nr:MAG: DNA-binding response regulator [Spirochaetaceae bacterium]
MAYIFVVEDNDGLRETIVSYLRLEEHATSDFGRLEGVMDALATRKPDLMILDVMLPDGDGFLFARKLRSRHKVPIIFLTARSAESDRITGFEVGGDDYVVKPFSMKELMLRVRAVIVRSSPPAGIPADPGGEWLLEHETATHRLVVNESTHEVVHDGRPITLTAAEWRILDHLSSNAGVVISRDRLLSVCLDYYVEGSERTIDTHVKNIRAKLGLADWIETVRGYGYRFRGSSGGGTG